MSRKCDGGRHSSNCLYGHNCGHGDCPECDYYYPIDPDAVDELMEREVRQSSRRGYFNIASNVAEAAGMRVWASFADYMIHERMTNELMSTKEE